jgi:hypothetical protein
MKLVISSPASATEAPAPATKPAPQPPPRRSFADALGRFIPTEVGLILVMFVVTRAVLILIGVASRAILQPLLGARSLWTNTPHLWLDIWGGSDARWYLDIVRHGYSTRAIAELGGPNYALFPAYPLLVQLCNSAVGNPYLAGLVVSNVCLLLAAYGLYKLVRTDADPLTALGAIKYLFLFPIAFIYSGFLPESLFMALLVWCFFFARRGLWLVAAALGFALTLVKPIGVVVVLPLLLDYAFSIQWSPARIGADILSLLLIPLGVVAYGVYTYQLTGDLLALAHVHARWYQQLVNPFDVVINGLAMGDAFRAPDLLYRFGSYCAIAAFVLLLLLIASYKRRGVAYWVLGMCMMLAPLASGTAALPLMPRVTLVIFPLYLMVATIATASETFDHIMTITLALLQGFLMVFWTVGTGFVL